MAKSIVKPKQLGRVARAIPPLYIFMYLGLIVTLVGITIGKTLPALQVPVLGWWPLLIIVIVLLLGLGFICYQTRLNYKRSTYDPTWALRFQTKFDQMGRQRLAAATLLRDKRDLLSDVKKNQKELEGVDDGLDFFEDVGFYMQGDYITPEVAHHQFYHWLRGYYLSGRPYIDAWQAIESARWENVENLYRATNEIEYGYPRRITEEQFDEDERGNFLTGEVGSAEWLLAPQPLGAPEWRESRY